MRGFMGLVNQSTFCLSKETGTTMELLKENLKSTRAWKWDKSNQENFDTLKKQLVIDCEKGIKRLTPLVVNPDWSKAGSGFCLYEVTCSCPKKWEFENEKFVVKTLCCPENWRLIMAGGRFNGATEAAYAPGILLVVIQM